MGGVGPLPSPRLEETALTAGLEEVLQETLGCAAGQQAVSELAQHAEVKARIGQLQAEKILPVDSGPYSLGRLAVAQALAELHQRDERQSPGWIARLTLLRIEVGEVAIREDGSEFVAQGQIGTAFGEGGLRDADGLLGHGRDRVLRVERHDRASSSIRPPTPLRSV